MGPVFDKTFEVKEGANAGKTTKVVLEALNTGKNVKEAMDIVKAADLKSGETGGADFIEKQLIEFWSMDDVAISVAESIVALGTGDSLGGLVDAFMNSDDVGELHNIAICSSAVEDIKGDKSSNLVRVYNKKISEMSDVDYNSFSAHSKVLMEIAKIASKEREPKSALKPNPFRPK